MRFLNRIEKLRKEKQLKIKREKFIKDCHFLFKEGNLYRVKNPLVTFFKKKDIIFFIGWENAKSEMSLENYCSYYEILKFLSSGGKIIDVNLTYLIRFSHINYFNSPDWFFEEIKSYKK